MQSRLTKEYPTVTWQAQKRGMVGSGLCSESLRTHSNLGELKNRLGGLVLENMGKLEGRERKGKLAAENDERMGNDE